MPAADKFKLRKFAAEDGGTFVGLWNSSYTRDPITLRTFVRQTLGDPNFSPDGCWLAEEQGKPAGFCLAMAPGQPHLFGQPTGIGRITGIGVLPEHRRRGIGSALLESALSFLKARSCRRVSVAAHEYYVAGLDKEAYPEGLAFLAARGFKAAGEAVAMGRMLYDLEWPGAARQAESRLAGEGILVKHLEASDSQALVEFFRSEFPTWIEFYLHKLDAGDDSDDIVVCRTSDKVVGFCQRLEADHIGPFGVAEAWRNKGLGTVMLYRLLDGMRRKGFRFAWFGETGRAQPYYERAGFFVTRRYAIWARDIS